MTRLSDEAVAAMADIHRQDDRPFLTEYGVPRCPSCGQVWPCDADRLLADRAALVAEVKEWEEVAIKNAGDALDWEGRHYRLNEQLISATTERDRLAAERRADAERVRVLTDLLRSVEHVYDEEHGSWFCPSCDAFERDKANADPIIQHKSDCRLAAALATTPPPGPA